MLFKNMRNVILSFLLLCSSNILFAQFQWAEIGVSGLTCSACSRSVEMSLQKLVFVDSVIMDLEHTSAKVIFKKIALVEIKQIAQAVIDAGFSVTSLQAEFVFRNTLVNNNFCFSFEKNNYQFLLNEAKTLNGKTILFFIGAQYLSKKEVAKWKAKMNKACTPDKSKKEQLYYVTL